MLVNCFFSDFGWSISMVKQRVEFLQIKHKNSFSCTVRCFIAYFVAVERIHQSSFSINPPACDVD